MSTKLQLFRNVNFAPFETGHFGTPNDDYEFGVDMTVITGTPVAVVVVEKTTDGGFTWTPVVTFTMDTDGGCATPAGAPLSFDAVAVRARVTSLTGGQASLNAWMK